MQAVNSLKANQEIFQNEITSMKTLLTIPQNTQSHFCQPPKPSTQHQQYSQHQTLNPHQPQEY